MFGSRWSKKVRLEGRRLRIETLEDRRVMSANQVVESPLVEMDRPVQTPAAALTPEEWVHSLTYNYFHLIPPDQIQYLTPAQVATIPNTGYLAQWTPESRAALSVPQVQALKVSSIRIDLLTTQQKGWLTTAQIQSMQPWDLELLSAAQIPQLTTTQISALTNGFFSAWTPAARAALTVPQIQALDLGDVRVTLLAPVQRNFLTGSQIRTMPVWDLEHLTPAQIPELSAAQVAALYTPYLQAWTPQMRAALTLPQVQAIDVTKVHLGQLTPQQAGWLTDSQIRLVSPDQFAYLNPLQTPKLTTAQIAAMTNPVHFGWMTSAARAALTGSQIQAINVTLIGIDLLTSLQIYSLTTAQVNALHYSDFVELYPYQVHSLTRAQIASIPSFTVLMSWTEEARAAMNWTHIQSLANSALKLSLLTPEQVGWLLSQQVQSLSLDNFQYLGAREVPWLTTQQIASMTTNLDLLTWSSSARAALTAPQVQALNVGPIRINVLTPTQISWLTTAQVRSLQLFDFEYLHPSQIPLLTTQQIATIGSPGILAAWSPAATAALTQAQVRALRVGDTGISHLNATQVSWLTSAQVQLLKFYELPLLNASQVPFVTFAQFASITAASYLHAMSPSAQSAISLEQFLSVRPEVWAEYSLASRGPTSYHPAVHMPIGPDGIPISAHLIEEANKFFALVPLQAATHTTVASGDWTNPAVWSNGVVPTAGAKVVISAGTTVRFNAYMNTAIKTLRIDGALQFAVDLNTQLKVDTVVVTSTGKLHIGTETNPIRDNVTARILIADGGPIDTVWDPNKLSRGVLSRGEVRMYGKVVTPYVNAVVDPSYGDTQLVLSQVPVNWKVGDRLVISGTQPTAANFGAEERTIVAIQGNVVAIAALYSNHHTPAGYGQSVQIANLSRNIEFVAEDSSVIAERPHMVFFHNPNVEIENIGVHGFGRTDKSVRVNDPVVVNGVLQAGTGTNPRARYAIHFHHTGVNPTQAPANISGSVVVGSPGWGYVNHSSNVEFEDNVAYGVNGSAFVTEDGNEIGAMRRNLAISTTGSFDNTPSRGNIHDFGFNGHGFWFQGPGVEVVDNISSGSSGGAFAYFTTSTKNLFDSVNLKNPSLAGAHDAVPVEAVPIERFSGNTAYGARTGLELWHHLMKSNVGHSVIEDFTTWNTRMSAIEVLYSGHVTVRNSTLIGNLSTPTGAGIVTNKYSNNMNIENVRALGFEIGIQAPLRGTTNIIGGEFAAVQAIHIAKGHDTERKVYISGAMTFQTLSAAQLQGRKQYSIYLSAEVDLSVTSTGIDPLFTADDIRVTINGLPPMRLYYYNQLKGYNPFPLGTAQGFIPMEYLHRTNGQLMKSYGKSFGGEMISPTTVVELPGICAMVRYGF